MEIVVEKVFDFRANGYVSVVTGDWPRFYGCWQSEDETSGVYLLGPRASDSKEQIEVVESILNRTIMPSILQSPLVLTKLVNDEPVDFTQKDLHEFKRGES